MINKKEISTKVNAKSYDDNDDEDHDRENECIEVNQKRVRKAKRKWLGNT